MRAFLVGAGVLALVVTATTGPAQGQEPKHSLAPLTSYRTDAIAHSYVVEVADGIDPAVTAERLGVRPEHVYRTAFNGFAGKLDPERLETVRRSAAVRSVTQDHVLRVTGTPEQQVGSWGLDRIDQPELPLDESYAPNSDGSNVTAYIIDTGIDPDVPDFEGRAEIGHDATGGSGVDGNGHGTHVSGTIGGATYGVAKNVSLVGVKVLDDSGSGTSADVLAGMDWVAANATKPAVANMSLGGGLDPAINEAATRLVESGVFLSVAAGGSGDACDSSPASAEGVYTTAASDQTDTHASFSSFGACVEGYAPGAEITSVVPGGGTQTWNGTSMASPHIAGIAALHKSTNGDSSSADLLRWLIDNASADVIQGAPQDTPPDLAWTAGL